MSDEKVENNKVIYMTEGLSEELIDWWCKLDVYAREDVILNAFIDEKLDRMTKHVIDAIGEKLEQLPDLNKDLKLNKIGDDKNG